MMNRYDARPDFEGLWSVMDTITYLPATFESRRMVQMNMAHAIEVARLMNDLHRGRYGSREPAAPPGQE
jgi:hypothetical protein